MPLALFRPRMVYLLIVFTALWSTTVNRVAYSAEVLLPELGDASSSISSPAQEYELGQRWLRYFRGRVPLSNDPFLYSYLESLLQKLAIHSKLRDKRLDLIIVDDSRLNAFAVPGGIVGVNTGLFSFAESEQQLASVLAHELAHLSQRHYARSAEQQKASNLVAVAGLLAGVALAATAGGDAGVAALSAVQAGTLESQLRFSREMEQEADRLGMQTLVVAGMNPYAMPEMFEQMLQSARFQRRPPEFLLTHPITESRIADTKLRANRHPRKQYKENLWFHLMKARVLLSQEAKLSNAIKRFTEDLRYGSTASIDAARYGLCLSYTQNGQYDKARETLQPLLEKAPSNIAYTVAHADIQAGNNRFDQALTIIRSALQDYPNSYPLNVRYAELLMEAGQYELAESLLEKQVMEYPKDVYLWYLLAEVNGLAGNILNVHLSRAEYFMLYARFQKAEIQLQNALKLANKDLRLQTQIKQRLKHLKKLSNKEK